MLTYLIAQSDEICLTFSKCKTALNGTEKKLIICILMLSESRQILTVSEKSTFHLRFGKKGSKSTFTDRNYRRQSTERFPNPPSQ